jgi:uncharacterized membrane protein YoaT (DUF817 family)
VGNIKERQKLSFFCGDYPKKEKYSISLANMLYFHMKVLAKDNGRRFGSPAYPQLAEEWGVMTMTELQITLILLILLVITIKK